MNQAELAEQKRREERAAAFWTITVILTIVLAVIGLPVYYIYGSSNSVVTVINKTDHKIIGDTDTYLVFTEAGVFKNVDSWWWFKFNSSDVQNTFKEGRTYRIYYYGWRMTWFSAYPNVRYAKEETK